MAVMRHATRMKDSRDRLGLPNEVGEVARRAGGVMVFCRRSMTPPSASTSLRAGAARPPPQLCWGGKETGAAIAFCAPRYPKGEEIMLRRHILAAAGATLAAPAIVSRGA